MATLDSMTDKELETLRDELSMKVATISKNLEVINAAIQTRNEAETAARVEAVAFIPRIGNFVPDRKAVKMILDLKKHLEG